jgi:ubiquinone/menaquinone biosynthesis C-methylase UbiE
MLETGQQLNEVKEHYGTLASHYGRHANQTCEKMYRRIVSRFLTRRRKVLELGAGSSNLLDWVNSPFSVACDLSEEMLRMRAPRAETHCVVTAGERLPFRDQCFDGLFLINVLEHVSSIGLVVDECYRVLQPGGIWLGITPNGNWELLLDLAERWSLKIREGPHAFLTPKKLRCAISKRFDVITHRTFLLLPAGPPMIAGILDRVSFCSIFGLGFFQYLVAEK